MKIYSPPDNHILSKILFASKLYGVNLQHEVVPYGYKNKQFQDELMKNKRKLDFKLKDIREGDE